MTTTLYITRHGETEWNTEQRMQGWNDSPLTKLGIQQAVWLMDRLKDIEFDAIYSSPTGRAYKTAEIVKGDRKIEIITSDNLREIFLGDWEGFDQEQLKEKNSEQLYNFWNKPHLYINETGECFEDVKERIYRFVKEVVQTHRNKNILIITHTMALKSLMTCIGNKPIERLWDPPFVKQTSLTVIEFDDENVKIVLNADVSHHKEFNNTMSK